MASLRSGADLFPSLFHAFFVCVVLRKSRQPMTHGLDFCRCVLSYLANANCLPWLQPALGLFSLESVF